MTDTRSLRMSSMTMGPSRKRLGLGSLSVVGAAVAAAMSFAPAMAQSQLPLDASGNLNIGGNNVVTTHDSYVFGANNEVLYHGALVAGHKNKTSARSFDTVVLGSENNVDGDRNVVLGAMNTTSGNRSTAIGMQNNVSGYRSTAVGQNNTVTKQGLALGTSNSSEGENSAAIGHNSAAFGNKTIAMGDNARAFGGEGAIALGAGSRAYNANDIALGSNSGSGTAKAIGTAGVELNGTDYAFAGKTPIGTLSIGRADFERTITNVAAGRVSATSTDGVNGSQLHATNLALVDLNAGAVKYDRKSDGSVNKDNITLEGAISTDGGVTGGTKITNLAQGAVNNGSTDAVNGSQLYATNQNVATNATNIANNSTNITNLQNQTFKLQANGDVASAVKSSDTVQFLNGENINITRNGNDITVATAKAVAFDKVTVGNVVVDKTTNKITGIEAGTDTKDAVNKGQLDAVIAGQAVADALNVKYDSTTKDKVTLGGAGSTTPVQVSNVKAGDLSATSTDAVNGSQLYALGTGVQNIIGGNTTYDPTTGTYVNNNIGDTGKSNINDAIASVNEAATKAKTTVSAGDNVVVTPTTNPDGSSNYKVAVADDLNVKSVTANKVTVGSVSIDSTNVDASGNTIISGVGAGAISSTSTDAVNGSQLHKTNEKIADLDDSAVKYKKKSDGSKSNEIALEGGDPNAPVLISNVADGKVGEGSTEAVNGGQLYQVKTEGKNYTDQKFNQLSSEIGDVRKEARQAAAIGLAAASLRFDDRPGKLSAAVGGGSWRSEGALALGMGYTSESGRIRSNISATTSGGHWGVGAGLSFTFN